MSQIFRESTFIRSSTF